MKGSILHKYDEYQQAFLDEKLEPNTVYHLRANAGCVHPDTKITIRSDDPETINKIIELLKEQNDANRKIN